MLNSGAGLGVVRNGGKGRGQPEEHRQLELRTKTTVEQPLSLRLPWTRMNEPHTTGSWGRQCSAIEKALNLGIFDLLWNSGAVT